MDQEYATNRDEFQDRAYSPLKTITKAHRQHALFEARFDGKLKTSTNSRSMQCFDFLDLSSFRSCISRIALCTTHSHIYNLVISDSKKIRVCRRINARSRGKRVLDATLSDIGYIFYTRQLSDTRNTIHIF